MILSACECAYGHAYHIYPGCFGCRVVQRSSVFFLHLLLFLHIGYPWPVCRMQLLNSENSLQMFDFIDLLKLGGEHSFCPIHRELQKTQRMSGNRDDLKIISCVFMKTYFVGTY